LLACFQFGNFESTQMERKIKCTKCKGFNKQLLINFKVFVKIKSYMLTMRHVASRVKLLHFDMDVYVVF